MNKLVIFDRLQTNKGFIFIDVMLTTVIISIALIAISGLFIQAMQANVMAKDYTVAANLAQKQLELLKILPPEHWAGCPLPGVIPWSDQGQLPIPRYTVVTQGVSHHDSLVEVTVTVSWQDRGREGKLQLVTLYPAL